jgi:DNA-binding PadR family transcriptional regulator
MMPRNRRGWALRAGVNPEKRHSPLTVPLLEPALLLLLKEQPRHGYTLLADLNTFGMETLHPSVIYRTLREMEALQWIESSWNTEQTQGPPRRNYQLTHLGEEALQNWSQELKRTNSLITQFLKRMDMQ